MSYVVHYYLDDARCTTGKQRQDHPVAKGDVIYTQHGRAIVRSCRLDQSTPYFGHLPAWARPTKENLK